MATVVESSLDKRMRKHVGYHVDKIPDWNAFPRNNPYPELARSQIRYIGAGGSEKQNDPNTLPAQHFTLSMVHQPPGKYAASHVHEIEESFLVIEGVFTVAWEFDGEVILARLGAKDMVLQAGNIPHGFKNESDMPLVMSVMIGKSKPDLPKYCYHPSTHSPELSAAFGALPGKTHRLVWNSSDPHHMEMARHIVRYHHQQPRWNSAGFATLGYIGEGGAQAHNCPYRMDLIHLPRGVGVRAYERDVEDAYLVMEGSITVGWEEGGKAVEQRLGPRDVIMAPAGQPHYFRNDGLRDAEFMMVVGTPKNEDVQFRAR